MLPALVLALATAAGQTPAASTPPPSPAPAGAPAAPAPRKPPRAEKCKIVVFNLVGRALQKSEADLPAILTEALAAEVGAASGCDVTSQSDIVAMLDYEKQKAVCTDGSDSCLAEIGQAFGADRVVAGTVSRLASQYIVAAKLMNVKKGVVEKRVDQTVTKAADLRTAAKDVGARLFGAAAVAADAPADAPSSAGGNGALLWTGVVAGGVGALAALGGGSLAVLADLQLAQPKVKDKDAVQSEGLIALGVAGAGALVAVAGAALAVVGGMP